MNIAFDYPWALLGFAIFIPLAIFDYFSSRRKQIQKTLPKYLRLKLLMSRFFFRVFLVCVIAALAGPRWGTELKADEYRRAVDAVIALDVSRSMEVRDGGGDADAEDAISRLERGLSIAGEAVEATPGIRFGVAVSRNRGIVAVPLTWDSGTVLAFLDAAGPSLTGRGTNLESLLDAAAGAFQSSYPSTKVIVLVSDGEALSGSLKAALGRCKRNGIIVSSVAVGSDEGGIVPGENEIFSLRDSGAMRMAAGQTEGIYIDGNRKDASSVLVNYLHSLAPGSEVKGTQEESKAHWFMFIMLAIITFGASKLSLLKIGSRE